MKKANKITYGLLISLLTSCMYTQMTHLSEEDLEWVSCYEQGDTIMFYSNNGVTDTMVVTEKRIFNSRSPFYFSEGESDDYEATALFKYKILNNNDSIRGLFCIHRLVSKPQLYISYHLSFLYGKESDNTFGQPLITHHQKRKEKLYRDCFVADDTNSTLSEYTFGQDTITQFIWCKQYGLISFKFKDGRNFNIGQ